MTWKSKQFIVEFLIAGHGVSTQTHEQTPHGIFFLKNCHEKMFIDLATKAQYSNFQEKLLH
ncbi:CLUMA_CG005543, isoform A [Clunio marinus]|uniref:CLUMA_CG005543, isoform A n=1 Tax=Clunio marinus TaxID=568069 RepID=A0A1J1HV95_9DIPT|nr:CLUMA_CG005543, isoform A [Clunio marinus]